VTETLDHVSHERAPSMGVDPSPGDPDSAVPRRVDAEPPDPPLGRRIRYLPGLDGLRAVAVLAVVGYHADIFLGDTELVRGGFLGVEVFFVISGYLITSILLNQWRTHGRIDLTSFYRNRARRLLPALFATLGVTVVLSVLFLPGEVASLRGPLVASLAYVTNWFFIATDSSYFESVGRPPLLQHLWSLAVEEQFYLVWPILFVLGMRWLGRTGLLVAAVAAAVASASLMAYLHVSGSDLTRIYEGTDTRAAGLLIGVALAFWWSPTRLRTTVGEHAPLLLDGLGIAAGLWLVLMLFTTDEFGDSLYRFGFARVSVLTAIVIAIAVHPAARFGRWLGSRPLAWVGRRSYGIYLFHWPVFQLTRPVLDVPFTGVPLFGMRLALTFSLAELSFVYLETPVRQGAAGRWWRRFLDVVAHDPGRHGRAGNVLGGVLVVFVVFILGAVVRAQPPPVPEYLAAGAIGGGLPPAAASPAPSEAPMTTLAPAAPVIVPGAVSPPSSEAPSVPTVPVVVAPPPSTDPPVTRQITALGDSVMLGAAPALVARLPGVFVDAAIARQVADCLAVLRAWRDNARLGDVVVVHIGNNGTFRADQFNELREILAGVPRVVVVNLKVPRSWESHNNDVIGQGVTTMPNAVLVNWHAEAESHPEFFYDDGMHLQAPGAARYAAMVGDAMN
jgi:peptidoglycan/LPS O-acetylase OafA/YrhL